MSAKWMSFLVFTWVIAAIMMGIVDGYTVGTNESTALNKVMIFETISSYEYVTPLQYVGALPTFFLGIWDLATFNFGMFNQGPWQLVRWIILSPFIALFIYGLITTFIGFFQRTV